MKSPLTKKYFKRLNDLILTYEYILQMEGFNNGL